MACESALMSCRTPTRPHTEQWTWNSKGSLCRAVMTGATVTRWVIRAVDFAMSVTSSQVADRPVGVRAPIGHFPSMTERPVLVNTRASGYNIRRC